MEGYPSGSLDFNLPYLAIAGLTSRPAEELPLSEELKDQGLLLRSEFSSIDTPQAEEWQDYLLSQDARDQPWSPQEQAKPFRFRVGAFGRSFVLPPRRARLPEDTEPTQQPPVLHSPFSPLSPVASVYPDGLINAEWIRKHQDLVPSLYLAFYTLPSDPTLATHHDSQLKNDINNLRHALTTSGYKTRLAVAILVDVAPSTPIPEHILERLASIRRDVGLDSKMFFYASSQATGKQIAPAADGILSTLHVQALEYYRDLARHIRKKRNRGFAPPPTVPPTSGTSRTLSVQDWNVRYDFKLAVFSEFRREMDTALRSYDQAYEEVLSQDVMDVIPSWSPRWNEARLLTDIIAIRAIRCSLWNGQTMSAVRRWRAHRDRIADVVDRQGRGTNNYGWPAWESRWAIVMAQMMKKTVTPLLSSDTTMQFIRPEKQSAGERFQPWENMHHPGYWYQIAARHLASRRTYAEKIPEEDRKPPGSLPASAVASKAYTYDTYMCPEPYEEFPLVGAEERLVEFSQQIIDCLMTARSEFQTRKQHRMAAELSLGCAKEMARMQAWDDVVAMLRPLWEDMSFRSESWLDVAGEIDWLLREAAARAGLGELVLSLDLELLHRQFNPKPQWQYDLSKSLQGLSIDTSPDLRLTDEQVSAFASATFVFKHEDGKAGETCQAQLTITSDAQPNSVPVVLKAVRVDFKGSLKPIKIEHIDSSVDSVLAPVASKGGVSLSKVTLSETHDGEDDAAEVAEGASPLRGSADLSLKPGSTTVLEMAIPLREPGEARAAGVDLMVEEEDFSLTYNIAFREENVVDVWFAPTLSKRRIPRLNSHAIEVHPKPPKIKVKHMNPPEQYYTNEPVELLLDIVNSEQADAQAHLELHVFGEFVPILRAHLENQDEKTVEAAREESRFTGLELGTLKASDSTRVSLTLDPSEAPATFEITARVAYHLVTDPATPILQTMTFQVPLVNPFEANYSILPRLHPDPWPSLFDYDGISDIDREESAVAHPRGLAQKWSLECHYASFATENLQIVGLDAEVLGCHPGARCVSIDRPELPVEGLTLPPKSMQEVKFDLDVQKLTLDDRGPAALDVAFVIKWQRIKGISSAEMDESSSSSSSSSPGPSTKVNTTKMLVPRSMVLGTEPRVLATATYVEPEMGSMMFDITIENASSHFLTFGVSMEPSEEFAFSGPKQTTVHVLPVSRRNISYRILPLVRGVYVRPNVSVKDKYFQKVLRIIPTQGMKIDKEGLLVWVPPAEDKKTDSAGL